MKRHRFAWLVVWSALLCPISAGCGGGAEEAVPAKGRLLDAGKPLEVRGMEAFAGMVQVEFYRIGPDGQVSDVPETAVADRDGYFDIGARGLAPGKYRIAVRQWDPYPDVDKLGGKFDAKNSPIVREITGEEDILIDLSKPEG